MHRFLFCILNILIFGAIVYAPKNTFAASDSKKGVPTEVPKPNSAWEDSLINANIVLSNIFDGLADKLDVYLVGERISEKKNETSVKIENGTYSSESQRITNVTNMNVNLRLPNVEEYWQLKFTTYDDREDSRGVRNGYLRQTPREKSYGASLGLFRSFGKVKFLFRPRLELTDPLKISHSFSFETSADMKTYQVNPKIEFFAMPDKGSGVFESLNFKFELTDIYSLVLINDGEYQESLNLFAATNGFSLIQAVTDRKALSYNLFFDSNNRPHYHLDSYSVSVAWNQLIYKKILDYQITPHLDFLKAHAFKGVAGIVLNINLNF